MSEMKPGDTVRLKSGGPLMTVKAIVKSTGEIWCEWFGDKEELKGRGFTPTSLVKDDGRS